MSPDYQLTEQEAQHYQAQGFVIREGVFSDVEVQQLIEAVVRVELKAQQLAAQGSTYFLDNKRFVDHQGCTIQFEHEHDSNQIRVIEPVHLLDAAINALIDEPRLSQPMQALVGCNELSLWTGKLNLKAGGGSGFGWHQDSPYWMHDCDHVDQLPNVMITIDPQSPDNGCFQVIQGSHKQGILGGCDNGTQLGGFFTDPSQFDSNQAVAMNVPPGSLIFFSPHSVHGSRPNLSDSSRRAIILTYQPASYPLLKTGEVRNVAQA